MSPKSDRDLTTLFDTVVNGGYCSGCGACAAVVNSPLKMALDNYGRLQPTKKEEVEANNAQVLAVCPFSDESLNEDRIGEELFSSDCTYHDRIGYHLATYAGYVTEKDFRDRGSSGGMGTWILNELLNQNLIDEVIHVKQHQPDENDPRLFRFEISDSIAEIRRGAKSRYYPVEMSEVINLVRQQPARYAIVGVPCFIKSIRLLAKQDAVIGDRIKFCIGLVCGHLKTTRFADMFAWQCGIEPGNLQAIDFRKKMPQQNANQYGVEMIGTGQEGKIKAIKSNYELYGYLWGQGFFKYPACDYCDDVVAETADVTVGDAWLPQYVQDSEGTNVVVVRNPIIQESIEAGMRSGRLRFDVITADDVAQSQDAGLRHRREGLAYRLYLKDQAGLWRPQKRVKAQADHFNKQLRKIHQLRVKMANQSHVAFLEAIQAGDFMVFKNQMQSLVTAYDRLYQKTLWQKLIIKSKKIIKTFLSKVNIIS
ncbi:MAG: Coenzyme F420 hydrogenase/dehydrogenase, beta subunit C-terminal domain [Pleurocapsa sp.]